jgi:cellulose synthase/poly-beta-1,6-N-acetylglucosamine synthase-like glycosyltransferase
MLIFEAIFFLLLSYIVITSLYLGILTIAACFFKKEADLDAPPLKIAVVVPAHNEELQIKETIKNILKSSYPKEYFKAFVIADNCEDNTADIAKTSGANVFERTDNNNRGKGQALDWFFQRHKKVYEGFDAIAIVDADTELDSNFLTEISASLSCPDVRAVQGFYGVANPEDNWRTALSTVALNVFHHLRPAGRNRLGASAGLKGNGMAFKMSLIKKHGWPAHSIVEDLEFSLMLLDDGIIVHYNPGAIVYGEMAVGQKESESQRRRWEGGRFQIFKKYSPQLIRGVFLKQRLYYLDAFMDIFTAPLSLLVLGQMGLLSVSIIFYPHITFFICLSIAVTIFYIISGQILRKAPLKIWIYFFAAPLFIVSKIPAYFSRGKDKNLWERTKRKAEIERESTSGGGRDA